MTNYTQPFECDTSTRGGRLLLLLVELQRSCFWCKKKVKIGKYDKQKGISSFLTEDFLHHAKSTHGFDPEIVEQIFNDYLDLGT